MKQRLGRNAGTHNDCLATGVFTSVRRTPLIEREREKNQIEWGVKF